MEKLSSCMKKPSASNKVLLIKRLFNIQMVEGGSILDHLNDFNIVTNQLHSMGLDFVFIVDKLQ